MLLVERDGTIGTHSAVPDDGSSSTVAIRVDANPLRRPPDDRQPDDRHPDHPWTNDVARAAGVVVGWSGTASDAIFGDDPRTWLASGHRAFADFCDRIADPLARAGVRLLFQPHARHVLSDVASTRTALRALDTTRFGLALAPASMLTTSMLDRGDEHLERILDGLGACADLLVLDDLQRDDLQSDKAQRDASVPDDEPLPRPVALGAGILRRSVLMELIARHVPVSVPVVIRASNAVEIDSALDWLAG